MGLFSVTGQLIGPAGQRKTVDLLVDTGATLLVVPQDLARELSLRPTRSHTVILAGGQEQVWEIAEVRLQLDGQEVTTPCFLAPGGPVLLGAVALESLFLSVDPVARRLIPVKGYAG